jgi:D-arginine dehydrogenase
MNLLDADIVVVGGGLAGAAAAWQLARRGARRLTLLEQEPACGVHASGRSASMIRQIVPDEAVAALARAGAAFFKRPPADWNAPVCFEPNGSILLAAGKAWEALRRQADAALAAGVPAVLRRAEDVRREFPVFADGAFEGGVFCASDGVVDAAALLQGFLDGVRRAGGTVRPGAAVRAVATRGGRVAAVETAAGTFPADVFVNAAGAWANEVARMAGAAPLPLRTCRRHLFLTTPIPWADRRWPFIWDVTHGFYFRPDSGGLLLCACDEDELPPCDAPVDPDVQKRLADKLRAHAPRLEKLPIRKSWAGLRTLTPDGRFVIGWDPKVEGLFWVAGLGGHGVTACAPIGELAAKLIAGEKDERAAAFAPGRFA